MIYIGIDPGKSGALAFLGYMNGPLTYDMNDPDVMAWLEASAGYNGDVKALIEKVHSMPQQGVSTTFTFGKEYGRAVGWLEAYQIPFEYITPGQWWKLVKDSEKQPKDKKTASLELARRLFPAIAREHLSRKKDHNRAEALLIAEACRRKYENTN